MQGNSQATVSEYIRAWPVEEAGQVVRCFSHETDGGGERYDRDDECFISHDEEEVRDEVGDVVYMYSQGAEEDGREEEEEDDGFIDNRF